MYIVKTVKCQIAFFINTVIAYLQQFSSKTRKFTNHFVKLISTSFGYNNNTAGVIWGQVLFSDFEMITFYHF